MRLSTLRMESRQMIKLKRLNAIYDKEVIQND
jgi:hypothetical protein